MDANTQWVMTGTALLGMAGGVLGSFALLRRRALVGDVLAHAALPGVAGAFLATGTKAVGPLLAGAAIAAVAGVLTMSAIARFSRLKADAAMSLVLTVFFGLGIMLLGAAQRSPGGNQSGLDKFLFGQAAAIVGRDVRVITLAAALLCLLVLLLFKEFKLLAFDPEFGVGIGLPMAAVELVFNLAVVLAVVIGLEAVGVVLMAALLVTPAAAARCWTDRLHLMVPLSGLFGALSGALGTAVSLVGPRMPTGPLIVLAATGIFVASLLLAPRRGLLARSLRSLRTRKAAQRERLLVALYDLAEEAAGAGNAPAVTAEALERRRGIPARSAGPQLARLAREGLVDEAGGTWKLTGRGLAEAYQAARSERLHLVYLMHQADLDGGMTDQGVRPAFAPEIVPQLEQWLRQHGLEPRLLPGHTAGEVG